MKLKLRTGEIVEYSGDNDAYEVGTIIDEESSWEQRRYELVKDVLCATIIARKTVSYKQIIEDTDLLIRLLKEKQHE